MERNLSGAIAAAAKAKLGPLGLIRNGRSRIWIDDHGWWLLVVEFQPSTTGGFYINVGEVHLFIRRDHMVFEDLDRPLGGASTRDGTEDALRTAMAAAVEAVVARRARHQEGQAALVRLVNGDDDLVGGAAAALIGHRSTARRRLQGLVHPAYQPIADAYLRALDSGEVERLARSMTAETRARLNLPPTDVLWTT